MQRYDITIPVTDGQFTPTDLALVASGANMTMEGDFRTAAYMASMGGVVSYLPQHRMYGFSFFVREGAKRGGLYALYPDITEPAEPLIRPWHQFRAGVVQSRITIADAAYMLTGSSMRGQSIDPDAMADTLLETLNAAGFAPYITHVIDRRQDQPDQVEEEDFDDDESSKAPILVTFADKTMIWLTQHGPMLPMGLSSRHVVARTRPEAAKNLGSIFFSCWTGPSFNTLAS